MTPLLLTLLLAGDLLPWSPPSPPTTEALGGRLRVRPRPGALVVLLKAPKPALPAPRFVLKSRATGRVHGKAWLEMYVSLSDGGQVAVGTRDTGGPMAFLAGDFRDRPIELPFAAGLENRPTHLAVAIGAQGDGEIEFEPFVVEEWRTFSLTWFAAGGFALFLGVGLGLVVGLYALLTAIPGLRRTAYAAGRVFAWLGVASTVAAGGMFWWSLPSGFWIPLGVAGLLSAAAFGGTLPLVRRGVEEVAKGRTRSDVSVEPA